jgi:hypothetical protein
VVLGTLTVIPAAPVDTQIPVVVAGSGALSKTTVTTNEEISFSLQATDDIGVTSVIVAIIDSTGLMVHQSSATRSSGTATNGRYSASIGIPSGYPAGTYRVMAAASDATQKTSVGTSGVSSQYVVLGTLTVT